MILCVCVCVCVCVFKSVAYLAFEISLTTCSHLGNVGLSLNTEVKYSSLDCNCYAPKTPFRIMSTILDLLHVIR